MRTSLLAAAAAIALATPAAAQTGPLPPMPAAPAGLGERITAGTQTTEPLAGTTPGSTPAAATIAPGQLSGPQIRQIQQRLRAQGIPLRRVDGVWGPETAAALQTFQQQRNIAPGPGLDAQTLGLLGTGGRGQAVGMGTATGPRAQPGSRRLGSGGLPVSPPGGMAGPGSSPLTTPGLGGEPGLSGAYGGSGTMQRPAGSITPPMGPAWSGNDGSNPPAAMGTPGVSRGGAGGASGGAGGGGSGGAGGGSGGGGG